MYMKQSVHDRIANILPGDGGEVEQKPFVDEHHLASSGLGDVCRSQIARIAKVRDGLGDLLVRKVGERHGD